MMAMLVQLILVIQFWDVNILQLQLATISIAAQATHVYLQLDALTRQSIAITETLALSKGYAILPVDATTHNQSLAIYVNSLTKL